MYRVTLNRRAFVTTTAVSALSMLAPALWAQPRLEKQKIVIAVVGKSALCYLPLTVAAQLGYFKAEGLDVEIRDLTLGSQALQAVLTGTVDVVSGAFQNTICLQSRGQMFQAFVLQTRAPAICMGVSNKTLPQYQSVADLRGKRIGVSALGSASHILANLIFSRAGLKPGEVRFTAVGMAADALTAWRTGQLDVMVNGDPVMSLLEQKGEIRLIADARTLKGAADVFGGAMPDGCLYAPSEFIQKNSNTVQALTNAMLHSLKWLQTAGPNDLIKTVPEAYWLGDRALYLAAFNKVRESISPDGVFYEDGPRTVLRVLANFDSGIKAGKIALNATYTNDFANNARTQFKA